MSCIEHINTTGYSYDEWIRFAFDHPVAKEPWYYSEDLRFECNPSTVICYYTRLFRDPLRALSAYDEARLEQGFWFIGSQLSEWLWDDDIPLHLRIDCITAMATIFREFFVNHPLDQACYMWWDMLRYFDDPPDSKIVVAMVVTLGEILGLPARHCQISALHGLGHIDHGSRGPIIRAFLQGHPNLDAELVKYAEAAIAGQVL